ncbi:MAG: tripartite tricarboxylate transporter substrate binding protein [Xanthobacteraceae bacterium]|jgi:tripartite-type tricarboxylate transporter receptor subunit TctC|nr:tripartite tricarboxylate transporter substrate binding protein [Xanthobacteraceae bacterium]
MPSFVRATVASGLLLAAALIPAAAQDFSGKPIRMIVPFSAGGGTDISARLIGQKLGETLKTSVIVENKAGGNLIPAGKEVAGATPDGHTLYFISTSALITQSLSPDYPLDLSKFAAVSEVSVGPLILAVRNDLGVKTFRDVVDLAKKNPGKLKFASAGGTSTSLYLATELFRLTTGVNITIVPYKGSAPALNDLLGGHIDAMFDFMPLMSGQVKTGKVTPIGVTGAKRSPALPDVPTIRETGVQYEITGWYGILAPPGTPTAIVQKLRDEVAKAIAAPDIADKLGQQGMEPRGTQPGDFAKYVQSELAFYTKLIKEAGIKPAQQ